MRKPMSHLFLSINRSTQRMETTLRIYMNFYLSLVLERQQLQEEWFYTD